MSSGALSGVSARLGVLFAAISSRMTWRMAARSSGVRDGERWLKILDRFSASPARLFIALVGGE